MGAALARRDWGETVDDMAQNFPWQFAGNFQKWAGRWNEMPVDAHMLIALSAPRPVFISGGTADQWADPVGDVQGRRRRRAGLPAARQEGPRHDRAPALDTPLTTGDIGWTTTPAATPPPPPTGKPSSSFWASISRAGTLNRDNSTVTVPIECPPAERAEDGGVEVVDVFGEAELAGRAD